MTPNPRTQAEIQGGLALDAFRRGDAAVAQGEFAEARRWLERARRLAPTDPSIALSLASVMLMRREVSARALFAAVAAEHDVVGAWLGAAATARLGGDIKGAARDLAQALSAHVVADAESQAGLAHAIAGNAAAHGWCALDQDRRLQIHLARPGGRLLVAVDGARWATRGGEAVPSGVASVAVTLGGRHLLGSPLLVARMFRVEGVAGPADDGFAGWAWHPGAPDLPPALTIDLGPHFAPRPLTLAKATSERLGPFVRAHRFAVSADEIPPEARLAWVRDAEGRALTGSPVLVGAERRFAGGLARRVLADPAGASVQADILGVPAAAVPDPRRPVVVVIPAHRGARATLDCIASVRASQPPHATLLVIDDASPEPALAAALDRLAAQGAMRLIRRPESGGFPAAANAGLRAAAALPVPHDVVLLNSDTLVPPGWLDALREIVHSAADIGTATPLSNDATLVSYPAPFAANPPPSPGRLRRLAARAARVNRKVAIDIPTAVGFCMYLRRECLDAVGLLDEELFAQGYGEENDFCLRARHLGWRHVAAPGVFVAHLGGVSFGAARQGLLDRNIGVMARRHPGYEALIAAHRALDPLASARFRLDAASWAAGRSPAGATILITHDSGGGVARAVAGRAAELRAAGRRPILLRPVRRREGDPEGGDPDHIYRENLCEVSDGPEPGFPNLRFRLPDDLGALARLLRRDRPEGVEIHHLLGHHHGVTRLAGLLGIPTDIHVHDYACICPPHHPGRAGAPLLRRAAGHRRLRCLRRRCREGHRGADLPRRPAGPLGRRLRRRPARRGACPRCRAPARPPFPRPAPTAQPLRRCRPRAARLSAAGRRPPPRGGDRRHRPGQGFRGPARLRPRCGRPGAPARIRRRRPHDGRRAAVRYRTRLRHRRLCRSRGRLAAA